MDTNTKANVPFMGTSHDGIETYGLWRTCLTNQGVRPIRNFYNPRHKMVLVASVIPHYRRGEGGDSLYASTDTNRSQLHRVRYDDTGKIVERILRPCELGLLYRGSIRQLLAAHEIFRDDPNYPQWRERLQDDIVRTIRLRGGVEVIRAETDPDYARDLFDYVRFRNSRIRWTPRSHWFRKNRHRLSDPNIYWRDEA